MENSIDQELEDDDFRLLDITFQLKYIEKHFNENNIDLDKAFELLKIIYGEGSMEYYLLKIAEIPYTSDSLIKLLHNPKISIESYLELLVKYQIDTFAVDRILKVFGIDPSKVIWEQPCIYAKNTDSQKYFEFFEFKYIENTYRSEKPSWVSIKQNETKEFVDSQQQTEELAEFNTDLFKKIVPNLVMESKDEENHTNMGVHLCARFCFTTEIRDRYYGMVNRRDIKCCSFDGNCRMFTCNCCDIVDDGGDWFIGRCIKCLKIISEPYHALRMPLENGGWCGCYCSFDCLRACYCEGHVDDEINDFMISTLEFFMETVGVLDREKLM